VAKGGCTGFVHKEATSAAVIMGNQTRHRGSGDAAANVA